MQISFLLIKNNKQQKEENQSISQKKRDNYLVEKKRNHLSLLKNRGPWAGFTLEDMKRTCFFQMHDAFEMIAAPFK